MFGAKTHQNIHFYLVLAFCITIPFLYRGASVAITLITLNWLLSGIWLTRFKALLKPLPMLFFTFFAIHLLGMIYTDDQAFGWFVIERRLAFLVLPLVFFTSDVLNVKQKRTVIQSFIIGNILSLLVAYGFAGYQYFTTAIGSKSFFYTYLVNGLGRHPTYVGLTVSMSIFILLYALMKKQLSGIEKRISWILIPLFLTFLMMLSSRIIILNFVITFSALAIYYIVKNKAWLSGGIVLVGFIAMIVTVTVYVPMNSNRLKQVSNDARPKLWKAASQVIKEHPLIGVGTGDVQPNLQKQYESLGMKLPFNEEYNTHNIVIQMLVMLGIIGVMVLLVTFFYPMYLGYIDGYKLFSLLMLFLLMAGATEALLEKQEGVMLFAYLNIYFSSNYLNYKST